MATQAIGHVLDVHLPERVHFYVIARELITC
jgi:hypothetical protein